MIEIQGKKRNDLFLVANHDMKLVSVNLQLH